MPEPAEPRNGVRFPRHLRRPALAAGALVGVLAAAAVLSFRCDGQVQPPAAPGGPYEVPTIRVRLTAQPVRSLLLATTGGYRLTAGQDVLAESSGALPPTTVAIVGGAWRIGARQAAGDEIVLAPAPGSYLRLGDVSYRGTLRLRTEGDGQFVAINHADLEVYLAGVLPKELLASWHRQTYRALAIAARTFALYQMGTFGAAHDYDLGDNQASQVYGGLTAETTKSWDAVRSTYGVVLAFGEPYEERIFLAQYSACCGGTVNGAHVIRNANRIPPLMGGQTCTDCSSCPRYRWPTVTIYKADIFDALVQRYSAVAALDGLRAIRVQATTPYGRMEWVDAVGTNGKTVRLRAEDVRLALIFGGVGEAKKLYSMNCVLHDRGDAIEFTDGHGFGHGVGLCQWGAEGKAEKGWLAEQILDFYYAGAKLFRVY